jgi:AAA domain
MTNPDESYDDMPHVAAYDSFNDFVESGVPENWWHPQYRFKRFADRYPLTTQFQMAVCMLIQEAFRQNRRGGSARKQAHENVTQEFVKWGNLDHYLPGIKIEPDDLARYIDSVFNHCRAHHGFPKFLDRDELLVELGVMPNHGRRGDPAPARMLVYSMIPAEAGTVAYLFGPSQAGKTFVAVDLCHALADHDRKDFFGRAIDEHVGSVIIAAEGAGAIDNRILTVERAKSKRADPLPITWIPAPRISNTADIKALINQLKKIAVEFDRTYGVRLGLIVIDTELAAFQITTRTTTHWQPKASKKCNRLAEHLAQLFSRYITRIRTAPYAARAQGGLSRTLSCGCSRTSISLPAKPRGGASLRL